MNRQPVRLGHNLVGPGQRLFLIAGPCVVEDDETMMQTAEVMAELAGRLGLVYVFKASYLKANRLSGKSPQGPGLEQGLRALRMVKEKFSLPVCTDVHESDQAALAAEVADVLQIPAFLCRQTALIQAAAATGRVVNLKKGQFMDPSLMCLAVEKARQQGAAGVLLTERGSFFGYSDLVVDFRSVARMASCGCPVVFDLTHSLQIPGGSGNASGGQRQFASLLGRAAVAAGVDGLFVEVHPRPEQAISDRETMLPLDQVKKLLPVLVELADHVREKRILDDLDR